MKKIKLLYIVSTLGNTGPTNQLYGLIKNLDKDNFLINILTLSSEPKTTRIRDFKKLGITINSLNLSRMQMLIYGKNKLIKKVIKINPDIIHTSGIRADININKYLSEYNHCCTIHNYAYDDYTDKFGQILGNIMAYKHVKTYKDIDYPISCSYAIKNKYKQKHDINTFVVQNGIDSTKYKQVTKNRKLELRKKLNLDNEEKVFITVGSLIEGKDPLSLIKAFKNIKDDATLIILGNGPLFNKCNKISDENIILKGQVNNVSEYLQASDVFVSISKSEGLPMAVLEAIGTGLTVLLSNIEPHKEIIEKNNHIGDIFELGNKKELTNLINKYINLDNAKIAKKGNEARKTLDEFFSAEVMSNSYEKIYNDILNNQ